MNGSAGTWYLGSSGVRYGQAYEGKLDSAISHSGKFSLRIESVGEPRSGEFGVASSTLPADSLRGKTIHISAWVRTKDVTNYVNLWCNDGTRTGNGVTVGNGTHDWQQYSFDITISATAKYVALGGALDGSGTMWVDDVRIQVDGKDYVADSNRLSRSAPVAPKITLTDSQLGWLRSSIDPLTTTDPKEDLSDLTPIKEIVGNAQIVGLGEATHGTRQFFQLKHRIVEYLAQHMGFTIFAIEANMPEAYRLNDYVLHGKGDSKELLAGLYFWTWDTQEVLDMIEWMRSFNASGKGRIQFLGFDMQTSTVAAENVQAFLNAHDSFIAGTARLTYALVWELLTRAATERMGGSQSADSSYWNLALQSCNAITKHLASYPSNIARTLNSDSLAWAIQNAEIVTQAAGNMRGYYQGHFIRDSCMAWNVKWIHDHNPGAKIVLWAHDGHVAKDSGAMGWYLKRLYGANYVNVGFSFFDGTYTAVGRNGVTTYTADPVEVGSVEYDFHKLQTPLWLLDLRKSSATDPRSSWLRRPVSFRTIGAGEKGYGESTNLFEDYDGLIYVDHSDASVQLR